MHKIGKYEVTTEQFETYTKNSKEEIGELLIASANLIESDEAQLKEAEAEIDDLEQELEIRKEIKDELEQELESAEEVSDDLRADLELKDKTIRSLVEVCKHLASKAV